MNLAPLPQWHTLPNGVRLLVLHQPEAVTSSVSLFVRCGSAHEPRPLAGIGHVLEHMVFKGSATRDCRQINLDAERLGAEVNAHTDRDHTAFHMRGLGPDAASFVRMLADIVLAPRFPEDELARERAVVLQEFAEDEDDAVSAAYRLIDACCFGPHPAARPIIGTRRGIEAVTREALVAHVQRWYTGTNMTIAVHGPLPPEALLAVAEPLFAGVPAGGVNTVPAAVYQGGLRTKAMAGSSQSHLVLAAPLPPRGPDDAAGALAAALFGEGMSSPLLDELRERRGLVYYAACSADVYAMCGQFVVEASTAPGQLAEALDAVTGLLARQAERIDPVDLERARNQLRVKLMRLPERPHRLLEALVLDDWAPGAPRNLAEAIERLDALDAEAVRGTFAGLHAAGWSLAVTGKVARGLSHQLPGWMGVPLAPVPASATASPPVPAAPTASAAAAPARPAATAKA